MEMVISHAVWHGHVTLAIFAELREARDYHKALPGNVRRHAVIGKALMREDYERYVFTDDEIREQKSAMRNVNYFRSHKKHMKTCRECKR